jgi:hypothetical protein
MNFEERLSSHWRIELEEGSKDISQGAMSVEIASSDYKEWKNSIPYTKHFIGTNKS